MKRKIGILTSGGDCPGLNATIRAVAKGCYEQFGDKVEIIGIADGYGGLIRNEARVMDRSEFSGILTRGGTILGTSRTPYKMMSVIEEDNVDKIKNMKEKKYLIFRFMQSNPKRWLTLILMKNTLKS